MAIKKTLISFSVSSTKLTAIAVGEEEPIADNTFSDGRVQNNRIEIQLIK